MSKILYDNATKKWFRNHVGHETTVCKCEKCGCACMPMKKNISVGKPDWILAAYPECGRECWITPLLKTALSQGAVALCTECAIRKGMEK